MAVSGSSSPERTWSRLPDDNLADVYLRLSSSVRDRARFSSVCASWRAVAWWHPAPLVPVLLPWKEDTNRKRERRTRAHDLESGAALRVPLPWFARGKRLVGSYTGGWIAAACIFHHVIIVNLSSGAQVKLSTNQRTVAACDCMGDQQGYHTCTGIQKIIFSDYPNSSDCVLAAITGRSKLAVCNIGGSLENGWTSPDNGSTIEKGLMDIAFCKGKLYGLMRNSLEVLKFDIGVDRDGAPAVTNIPFVTIQRPSIYKSAVTYHDRYIFELRGKLAMALEAHTALDHGETPFFMVFEFDATPWGYMWIEVKNLDGHALFLGPTYSTAIRVGAEGQCGRLEKNHIYYFKQHRRNKPTNDVFTRLDLGCLNVYCWENNAVHRWGNQAVHRYGKQVVHHGEVQGLHRWANQSVRSLSGPVVLHQEVQVLRRSLGTMISSRGYHYTDDDGRNGCIWLFLPRDL